MLKNAYFLAKIGAETAENERNVAKIKIHAKKLAKSKMLRRYTHAVDSINENWKERADLLRRERGSTIREFSSTFEVRSIVPSQVEISQNSAAKKAKNRHPSFL